MINCPSCREPLTSETFQGVTVDGCRRCGGAWFDRGELTRVASGDMSQLAAIDRAFERSSETVHASAETGSCPACGDALARFEPPHTPGLTLTGCPAGHGTWLGEDDFDQMAAYAARWMSQHPLPPATAPARQRLRDAAHLLLSKTCPHCGQPNATACPICWACGAALMALQARLSCPRCRTGLETFSFEGIQLNHCGPCGALWLDHGELGALLQLRRELLLRLQRQTDPASPARAATALGAAPCPACHSSMQYDEYGSGSGIFIYSCDPCRGLWLDHAALVPLQEFALASEHSLPPRPTA